MLKFGRETDEKIRKLCDDISFQFITSTSIEPEFANVTGKDMSSLRDSLCNFLNISFREFLDENELIEDD